MITQDRLKEVLHYDPETGVFTWKRRFPESVHANKVFNSKFAGKIAGRINPDKSGYRVYNIKIDGKMWRGHKLAFLYMEGRIPDFIDHINRDAADNRWANLVESNYTSNNRNSSRRKDNSSGYAGVMWHKASQKWTTCVSANGKRHHLGYFSDLNEAIETVKEFRQLHGYTKDHGHKRRSYG